WLARPGQRGDHRVADPDANSTRPVCERQVVDLVVAGLAVPPELVELAHQRPRLPAPRAALSASASSSSRPEAHPSSFATSAARRPRPTAGPRGTPLASR